MNAAKKLTVLPLFGYTVAQQNDVGRIGFEIVEAFGQLRPAAIDSERSLAAQSAAEQLRLSLV